MSTALEQRSWARGLLVSVRDATEARDCLAFAAIVDVKEPTRGPLGRADATIAADVLVASAGAASVTLACGELAEGPSIIHHHLMQVLDGLPGVAAYPVAVKAGPASLGKENWMATFREFSEGLPETIEPVAVAYADWQSASSPSPHDIIVMAADAGARVCLIDTFDKSGPGLFHAVDAVEVTAWISLAHARGLTLALAGKLTETEVCLAFDLGADVVGVRSVACSGGRLGRIDPARLRALGRLKIPAHLRTAQVPSGE